MAKEKTKTTLKKISSDQLDKTLFQVLVEKQTKFVLLGIGIELSETPENWPDALQDSGVIYQLTEAVDKLVDKILPLTDLRCLVLRGCLIDKTGQSPNESYTTHFAGQSTDFGIILLSGYKACFQ